MRQVLIDRGAARVEDVPAPVVTRGSVLVEVAYSLISVGTEMAGIQSSGESLLRKALRQPEKVKKAIALAREHGLARTVATVQAQTNQVMPTGYSCAGTVIEVGDGITDIAVGDRVACAGAGIANHAEIVRVPRNLVAKIPSAVPFESAASATVGAIALQGVRRADNRLGETVAVIGLGLLGLMTVQMLKAAGCRVCAIDIDPGRVDMARKFGADFAINAGSVDPVSQIGDVTAGHGADSTIITAASESNAIVQQAMQMTRKKGKVVLVGAVGLGLKRSPFYEKEIDFLISCSYGPGRYDEQYEVKGNDYPYAYVRWTENRNMQEYLRLLADGKLDFQAMVDGAYPIAEAPSAYAAFTRAGAKPLAVLLRYDAGDSVQKRRATVTLSPSRKVADKIGAAVIGAGAFAQGFHLPNLKRLSDSYQLVAVSDMVGHVAKNAAKKFGAARATTDYRDVLADDAVDMVVITTRHNVHARLAIEALRAGKAVLCEKPMAMNNAELDELLAVIRETQVPYMCGFNRRFSPAATRVKKALSGLAANRAPLLINYRVNAEHFPPDFWVFTEEGGGRIVGEACHMFDFFNYFTESAVVELNVQPITVPDRKSPLRDNVAVLLRYANGDVCTLTYLSIGGPGLGKEYVEIHCGGASFVIDNYQSLTGYGVRGVSWSDKGGDKGHFDELIAWAKCLKDGAPWPVSLEDLISASRISYQVAERAVAPAS